MNKKILILVLFLFVAVAFSGCVQKQELQTEQENEQPFGSTQDKQNKEEVVQDENKTEDNIAEEEIDISNWKTYRNEEYGFEFKHPTSWKNFRTVIFKYDEVGDVSIEAGPTKKSLINTKNSIENKKLGKFFGDILIGDSIIIGENKKIKATVINNYFVPSSSFYRELSFFIGNDNIKIEKILSYPDTLEWKVWAKDKEKIKKIVEDIDRGGVYQEIDKEVREFNKIISTLKFIN